MGYAVPVRHSDRLDRGDYLRSGSCFLLEHAPQLISMTLVDISPSAIKCARDNIITAWGRSA